MKVQKKHLHLSVALVFLLSMGMSLNDNSASPDFPFVKEMRNLESSSVLLNNESQIIPFTALEDKKIAAVFFGLNYSDEADVILNKYSNVSSFKLDSYKDAASLNLLSARLKFFNTVIVNLTDSTLSNPAVLNFLSETAKTKQLILVGYGNIQQLQFVARATYPILWCPVYSLNSLVFAAQALFGGMPVRGKLLQNVSTVTNKGNGYTIETSRLTYTAPEEVGINGRELETEIDKIANEAIAQKATPGAVVMIVKDGKVIFEKGYGAHTYTGEQLTKPDDLFDLASVTKIGATTIAAMRLYEQQKLKLDTTVGAYIPLARNTSKNDLLVKELLLHQAGLTPYIPFFERLKPEDHSTDSSAAYPVKVADNYYLKANYFEDVMWPRMLNSKLSGRGTYNYSDLSMYMMKDIIERLTAERLDNYVSEQFYKPLGMYTAGFNPRTRFDKSKIVPTENDTYFRKTLLEGYVHDQGASMAGGVSGHAGLFARANDMAILFQMFLNGGVYGGKRYFEQSTIDLFTKRYSDVSRRGLGFDRWDPDRSNRYPSDLASPKSYGHNGYTGTCVWVDPEYNLIYIFLSNRVHPSVTSKLSSLRIRPRIQDVVYRAIKKNQN